MDSGKQFDLASKWLKGDESAVALLFILGDISQVWDDLIDRDKPVSNLDINRMMMLSLIDLNKNSFFVRHHTELTTILDVQIQSWIDSNFLEQTKDPHFIHVAFGLRSVLTPVFLHMVGMIGGMDWRMQAMKEIYPAVYDEPFENYLKEHASG